MRDHARPDGKCEKGAQREQTFLARYSIPSQWTDFDEKVGVAGGRKS